MNENEQEQGMRATKLATAGIVTLNTLFSNGVALAEPKPGAIKDMPLPEKTRYEDGITQEMLSQSESNQYEGDTFNISNTGTIIPNQTTEESEQKDISVFWMNDHELCVIVDDVKEVLSVDAAKAKYGNNKKFNEKLASIIDSPQKEKEAKVDDKMEKQEERERAQEEFDKKEAEELDKKNDRYGDGYGPNEEDMPWSQEEFERKTFEETHKNFDEGKRTPDGGHTPPPKEKQDILSNLIKKLMSYPDGLNDGKTLPSEPDNEMPGPQPKQ